MAVPAIVAWKERDNVGTVLQIVLYFLAFVFIIYMMYKMFGMFKDAGKHIEDLAKKAEDFGNDLKNDLEQAPEKFRQTGEDIWTMITQPGTPEGNAAKTRVHYGGPEWEPGNAGVDEKGNLHKYGDTVKPGETKTYAGSTYIETVKNTLVKSPYSSKPVNDLDALAMKYGFSTYAQFNAWLEGVKAALKAAGKDPNQMSLDQIVKYGRELERKKEEWRKKNPDKATPKLDVMKDTKRPWLKPLPLPEQDQLIREVYPKTPGGGIVIGYTPVITPKPKPKPGIPPTRHILPIRTPIYAR
ncbi:hypothetical protein APY94_02980 [Thermococcus celericrescens]|uniref:Uncharacterized protein n=1 Tax=Thermococcus celericrescens TaxID=227598 RepID=A0A100XYV4_9EURY|nr:hypothetical protein [Thermococcus celericrescens]KUH34254.1 hypothetical protein APY94_02980 [Thermococcus celericrescens]